MSSYVDFYHWSLFSTKERHAITFNRNSPQHFMWFLFYFNLKFNLAAMVNYAFWLAKNEITNHFLSETTYIYIYDGNDTLQEYLLLQGSDCVVVGMCKIYLSMICTFSLSSLQAKMSIIKQVWWYSLMWRYNDITLQNPL